MTTLVSYPQAIKAALFVDFDNIYWGLRNADPRAADEFATNPAKWVSWFERGMPAREDDSAVPRQRRALLMRRCYLNPAESRNYRAYFTRAGFSVVDCPTLTQQGKNSSDIVMVMDILDTLGHSTRFDEFIILSGDADFTPVLLRLRIHDRRTVIVTPGPVAQSYKAASDHAISSDVFIEDGLGIDLEALAEHSPVVTGPAPELEDGKLLDAIAARLYEEVAAKGVVLAGDLRLIFKEFAKFRSSGNWLGFYSLRDLTTDLVRRRPEMCIVEGDPSWVVSLSAAPPLSQTQPQSQPQPQPIAGLPQATEVSDAPNVDLEDLQRRILDQVRHLVAESDEPVNMASAAWDVIHHIGQEVLDTRWAGAGTFKDLLLATGDPGFEVITAPGQPGVLLDPRRHTLSTAASVSAKWDDWPADLATFARRINRVTGTPLLTPTEYELVFQMLEEELSRSPYFLSTTSKSVRDRCIERGSPIARKSVNFILQGIAYAGHVLGENPSQDTAAQLAAVFRGNVNTLCRNAQLELSDDERRLLDDWIRAGDGAR